MVPGHGYNEANLKRFKAETGGEAVEHTREWDEWRTKQVVDTIDGIRKAIASSRHVVPLSAAALGAWDLGYGRSWTDYRKALELGKLDFVVLMSYYSDDAWVWKSILNSVEVADAKRVIVGLGPYVKGNTPEKIAQQIAISRSLGTGGFCLFSLDNEGMPGTESYLAQLRHLVLHDVGDDRYSLRDPVWNRVGVIDDAHRQWKFRFYSRNGKTKLVVYQHGLKSLRLSVNGQLLPSIDWKDRDYAQLDLSPILLPGARDVAADHDYTLHAEAEGLSGASAEVFTVDYYAVP
jgi:hypothetical protein